MTKTISRIGEGDRMSDAVVHNGTVYVRGIVPGGSIGEEIETQAMAVFSQIDSILEAAGSSRGRLLSVTIWLSDIADLQRFNAEYDNWLRGVPMPARACTQAKLFRPDCNVEVSVIAAQN